MRMRESGAKEGRRLRRTAPGVVAVGLGILVACLLLEEPQAAPRARAERREGAAPSLRAALVLEAVASTSSRPSSGAAAIAAVASRDLVATRLVWPAAIAGAPALPGMPSPEESPLVPGLDRISLHGVVSSGGGTVP